MRVPDDSPLALTAALRDPATAAAAVRELAGRSDAVAVEGLLGVVLSPPSARVAVAALTALESVEAPLVRDAAAAGLASRHAPVRLAAVQLIHRRRWDGFDAELADVVRSDPSWPNRRAAVLALADRPDPVRWDVLHAADDPHWRVRHALIRVLVDWPRDEVLARLADIPHQRAAAVAVYLRWAWGGAEPESWEPFAAPDPVAVCPFWDWDPAVLAAKLNRLGKAGRETAIDAMPFLAAHDDERVWKQAVDAIREFGEPRHFAEVVARRRDPRTDPEPVLARLFDGLGDDRAEETGWTRPPPPPLPTTDLHRRAAALTPERAAELVAHPTRETSWHVLDVACRLARVPVWEIEPATPWRPPESARVSAPMLDLAPVPSPHTAFIGKERLAVSRLGISGHYLLPPEGFARAAEAGVNWFFWEPNYDTLTAFSHRLGADTRRRFHFVAGTFEADGERIVADAERAVRALRCDRLGLFLVFWVQSWDRLTDDVRDAVERLKSRGIAEVVGLSTHHRPLAVRAIDDGWNPVMVRHSAAHRGAETAVFPHAAKAGTSVITFNNLCYGRLLRPVRGLAPPDPADCYRFTLSTPGVSACWSAPSTLEQLEANLRALRDPELPPDRRAALEAFGAELYREETVFRRLVRVL